MRPCRIHGDSAACATACAPVRGRWKASLRVRQAGAQPPVAAGPQGRRPRSPSDNVLVGERVLRRERQAGPFGLRRAFERYERSDGAHSRASVAAPRAVALPWRCGRPRRAASSPAFDTAKQRPPCEPGQETSPETRLPPRDDRPASAGKPPGPCARAARQSHGKHLPLRPERRRQKNSAVRRRSAPTPLPPNARRALAGLPRSSPSLPWSVPQRFFDHACMNNGRIPARVQSSPKKTH